MLSRRAVGTPVFGGMLAASLFGIFMIPMLYVVFQTVREKVKSWFGVHPAQPPRHGPRRGAGRPAADQRVPADGEVAETGPVRGDFRSPLPLGPFRYR